VDTVDLDVVRRDDAYLDDLGDGAPPNEGDLLGAMLAAWRDDVDDGLDDVLDAAICYVGDTWRW
jgi:hypothetical protein